MTVSVFPLPLTSFEKFHCYRHSDAFPNIIYCRFFFHGSMDRDIAEAASEICLDRQPMLGARLQCDARGQPVWVRAEDRSAVLEWADPADDIDSLPSFDITKGTAVRAKIVNRDDSCDMLFQIHHAAVDGIGALVGIHDWLVIYANLFQQRDPLAGLRRLDLAALQKRGSLGLTKASYLKTIPFQWIALYGMVNFSLHQATPLVPPEHATRAGDLQAMKNQLISRTLEGDDAAALEASAQRHAVTTHEILVSRLFLAVSQWRQQQGWGSRSDRFRIIVPANLRDASDRRLPAANRMTMHYLDRVAGALDDADDLVRGIRYELGVINRFQLQKTFLMYLSAASLVPGMLKRTSQRKTCFGTTLITNLGAPWKRVKLPRENGELLVGNLRVKRVELVPPLYELTPVSFSVSKYAGKTNLLMRFDPRVLTVEEANDFMSIFLAKIRSTP